MQEVSKYVNEGRPDVDLTTDVDTPGLSVWPRLPMAVVRMAASTKAVAVVVAGQVRRLCVNLVKLLTTPQPLQWHQPSAG